MGQAILDVLHRVQASRHGIAQARAGAAAAAQQGYRVEPAYALLDEAETALRAVLARLPEGPGAVDESLARAAELLARGVDAGQQLPVIHARNQERIAALAQAGDELPALIEAGQRVFDMVDEYAESTWSDIRGNGSEAEAAAERAELLWERAQQRNTMEAQAFLAARDDLDVAEEQVALARQLLAAISQRLQALEKARDTARAELADAEQDLQLARQYVHEHDRDVAPDADARLASAHELLGQAHAEIEQPRPDWFLVVRQARTAAQEADTILMAARDEVAQTERLEAQLARTRETVSAEVEKIAQFEAIHSDDLSPATREAIEGLRRELQAAFARRREADTLEDQARRLALQDALERYTRLDTLGDQVYAAAYNDFQEREKLRKALQQAVNEALTAIQRAEQRMGQYAGYVGGRSDLNGQLAQARALLERLPPVRSEAELRAAQAQARQAAQLAQQVEQAVLQVARQQNQQPGDDLGELMTGVLIGTLLNSGRRGHHNPWGSSGGFGGGSGGRSRSGGGSRTRHHPGGPSQP